MRRYVPIALACALFCAYGCNRSPAPTSPAAPAAPAPSTAPAAPATPTTPAPEPATTPPAAPAAPAGASVAGEPIPGLPDYPNATRLKYAMGGPKVGFRKSYEVELLANDTIDNVKAYYKNAIATGGWTVVKTSEKPDEAQWDLTKGTSTAEIDLELKKTGGVSIKLERKDR